ncbi:hypothetical protein GCM10027277_13300 [Pseudoduganella ginsengisoli]|uniref:HPt domain-containing protein n=1 Tax=Pseudoduganella ginsengisoli TaxID=1462440 RepID=A0A6L6PW91_9BURK|nr:Hpt domain-containing protein [Pseudoduganella ginsengisoli]MTW01720.1 hypothetical protein [Pseudoduganella ginsengisoli]
MTPASYHAIDPWALWDVAAGDLDVFRTLAWIYLQQAPLLAQRIRESRAHYAAAEIYSASHTLKGMAGLLGATELCSVLEQLELAAKANLPLPAAADRVDDLCARVLSEVETCSEQFDGIRPREAP